MKYIEMRGDDPLDAVVEGTEANAHLVAGNGLAWGVDHAAEQYHISTEMVLAAIKFYLDNREEIEAIYKKDKANSPSQAEELARIKRKSAAYRAKQKEHSHE